MRWPLFRIYTYPDETITFSNHAKHVLLNKKWLSLQKEESDSDMNDLAKLKADVELKFGREINTPSAFDSLFLEIKKDTGKEVSVSTLKRVWGYVRYDHHPRHEILSILSKYLGFKDWNDYLASNSVLDSSAFLTKDVIESRNLKEGDRILIGWAPNRACELKYLGNSFFEVVKAQNSKIRDGDTFSCSVMAKGEPLMCCSIKRDGKLIGECYIAAKSRGLNKLAIKS